MTALPYWLRRMFRRPPRWVLLALGIAALLLVIWFVGPLIAIAGWAPLAPVWVRVALIAILIAVVAGRWGWRRWQARRRNRALVAELEGVAAPVAPDDLASADIQAMNDRAAKALTLMRDARVGRGREFVYDLPWYIIIGPPGAGKTTALKNSGLDFPIAQEVGDAPVRGIGGTRTIEWWFTDRAVLIDTAGRYTTQDSDEAADAKGWRALLDLLKRHRPRQPVTGIIVAISVTDLAGADESGAVAHGRAVRARINEVQTAFGVRTPIYLLLTKMDLLAGFTEFFDDLSAHEREQVWGETWPLDAKASNDVKETAGSAAPAIDAAIDGLLDRLDARVLARMQAEPDMMRRSLIFGFPQQFASLREPLGHLVRAIGRSTQFEPAPLIRGFYFTSGTQFGRPIDRLLGALSQRFGLPLSAGRLESAKGRSYFLSDLLRRVIFPEAAIAGRDLRAERRARLTKLASIGGAGAIALLLLSLWTVSYWRTSTLIDRLGERSALLRRDVAQLPQGPISDTDVVQLLEPLGVARTLPFASTAAPADRSAGFGWGIGRTGSLRPQVDGAYRNLLNRQFLPRLLLSLEDQLRQLSGGQPTDGDPRARTYALLRLYLMLGRAPGAPLDRAGILATFDDQWANALPGEDQSPARDALHAHLASLLAGPVQPPRLNATLIEAARGQVASLGPGERVYAQLLGDPTLRALPPFAIADVPGVATSRLFTRKSGKPLTVGVPGMFRRRAFFASVLPAIGRYAALSANEDWVSGQATPQAPMTSEAGRVKDALVTTYLADFTKRWDDTIDDVVVSGERPMDERLQVAVRPPSPVKALFNAWADETNLTPPSLKGATNSAGLRVGAIFSRTIYRGLQRAEQINSATGQAPQGPPGPLDEVVEHFRWLRELSPSRGPSPVDDALIALTAVGDTGTAARSAAGLGDAGLQRDKVAGAMAATARLGQVAGALPPAAGRLFNGFVTASTSQLNKDARAGIAQQYSQQLLPECRAILAQGFPFSPSAHEVSVDDFSRLLRPGGLIDSFQTTSLAGQVDTSRRFWALTPSGRALGLSSAAVRQFQSAADLRTTFFKPGDIRPNVRIMIEPLQIGGDASVVTLTVDGAPAAFGRMDRRGVELRWPGPQPGATLSVQHAGSAAPAVRSWTGDWAFLRMVRSARISNATRSGFVMSFVEGGATASFRVRMLNTDNPFMLAQLASFRCPGSP